MVYDIGNSKLVVTWRRRYDEGGASFARRGRATKRGSGVLKKIASLNSVEDIYCVNKTRLIAGFRQQYKLADLLQIAGLARSTFDYQGHAAQRANPQSAMEPKIRAIYEEYKGRYGYRIIRAALCNSTAEPVKHKRLQRLMQKMGLRALIRGKKSSKHISRISEQVPNVLERGFCATAPNQ